MTEKEVLEIIEEAARDGRTSVDLSEKGIGSLPGEIGKLMFFTECCVVRKTAKGMEFD